MSWDFENRLELARRMGYPCGDHGDLPDRRGSWFTKPIRNPVGMGVGARANGYAGGWARALEPGGMWMPAFSGEHYSVDFRRRGGRWAPRALEVPAPLADVDAEWLNAEFIGGGTIEAQGRRNTDCDRAPRACALPASSGPIRRLRQR